MEQRRYLQAVSYKSSLLISLLILVYYTKTVTGSITLSPMSVAPVCRAGDSLQLTCTAFTEFLEWSIRVINENGRLEEITVFINSRDMTPQSTPRVVNATSFTFMRISAQIATPLISTLSIDSVIIGLNGTVVSCKDAVNTTSSALTTIQIVDFDDNLYAPPLDTTISQEYKDDNVTVTVEWIQHVYTVNEVTVVPLVPLMSTGSTSRQLTIQYNTEYNLSLEATAPCRPNAITFIILNYANCGHPDELLSVSNDSVRSIELEDYDGLPVEGSTVRFRCLSGLELVGEPNSVTCTANGAWEPSDYTGLTCTNSSGTPDSSPATATDAQTLRTALISVTCILVVISILTFIIGFACGHCFSQRWRKSSGKKDESPSSPTAEDLELKENVAYITIHPK